MMQEVLEFEVKDGVGIIRLNRPERLNAMSPEMLERWESLVHSCRRDDSVGAVVVTGNGRGFCSGMDLKANGGSSQQAVFPLRDSVHRVAKAVRDLDKPYIAAINGVAAGAGMDMASMADIRFMSRSARVIMSYSNLGLIPGDGGCYYLPRAIGTQRALDLMWTGRPMGSDEALLAGYCLRVCDDESLLDEVLEYAVKLAQRPRMAIQMIRRLTSAAEHLDVANALELTEVAFALARRSEDAAEGIAAAKEGREARFKGA